MFHWLLTRWRLWEVAQVHPAMIFSLSGIMTLHHCLFSFVFPLCSQKIHCFTHGRAGIQSFWHNNPNPSYVRSISLTRVPLPYSSHHYPVLRPHRSTWSSPSCRPRTFEEHTKSLPLVRHLFFWLPFPFLTQSFWFSLCHNVVTQQLIKHIILF